MRVRSRASVLLALITGLTVAAANAQQTSTQQPAPAARPQPTYENQIMAVWKGVHDKIFAMAKDWPEAKYGWKPHADSRTMLDEFRHVTIGLEMSAAQLKGVPFNYLERIKADETKPKTQASVVAEMQAAMTASYALVASSPTPQLIFWIDHQAEHYGKLVSNYRMNGVVPPISRLRGGL